MGRGAVPGTGGRLVTKPRLSAQYEIPYYWRFEIDVDVAGLAPGWAEE
jgi:hypothetical protein